MYILQQRYFLVYLPTLSNQDCPTDPVHISGVLFWRRTSCVFVLFAVNVARCRATFIPALVIVLSQMSSSAWFELFQIFDCLLWKTIVKWQTICLKCQRSCLLFYQIKSKFFTQWESFWTGILQAEWRLCLLMYDKNWKQVCESRSKSVIFMFIMKLYPEHMLLCLIVMCISQHCFLLRQRGYMPSLRIENLNRSKFDVRAFIQTQKSAWVSQLPLCCVECVSDKTRGLGGFRRARITFAFKALKWRQTAQCEWYKWPFKCFHRPVCGLILQ